MDHKKFDELVVKLTSGQSRRDAVKGIIGTALTAVGASTEALAKGHGGGKGKGGGGGKGHGGGGGKGHGGGGKGHGGGGGKGHDGGAGAQKHKNKKKKKCKLQPGETRCSKKVCVNLQTDFANCGNCGNSCLTGQFCQAGSCKSGT